MTGAVSLDPIFLAQRRRLVASQPNVFGLEQAAMHWQGEGIWKLRLQFIRSTAEPQVSIPPDLAAESLSIGPVMDGEPDLLTSIPSLAPSRLEEEDSPAGQDTVSFLLRGPADSQAFRFDLPQWKVKLTGVQGMDPFFSSARINLLVDEPSSLPPPPPHRAHGLPQRAPEIDYLAKDYASFRREMLDDLAAWVPDLANDSPAAQNFAVVELLAFAGDYLSYFQDAAGTEAYLATARRRVSVVRHAQLLDYQVLEGTNSRVWVSFQVDLPSTSPSKVVPAGTAVLTSAPGLSALLIRQASELSLATSGGAQVFETVEDLEVETAMNRVDLHDWGVQGFSLPSGSVEAALCGLRPATLEPGRVLLLVEAGRSQRCHAVRVTAVSETIDPATGTAITIAGWDRKEALPFPLPVTSRPPASPPASLSSVWGNVVLADFGATLPLWAPASGPRTWEPLPPVPDHGRYRPRLPQDGVIFRVPYDPVAARDRSAADSLVQDPKQAMPAVQLWQTTLAGQELPWTARRTLLESGRFAPDFVVETEESRESRLRFGDGWQGQRPAPGTRFSVSYRVAFGSPNIGRNSLAHVVADAPWITGVANPLPAVGATSPEATRRAALLAPHAYQAQERCVTAADYVAALERHHDVLHATVELRSTGSWTTAFAFVQLRSGKRLDGRRRSRLAQALAKRTMAGTGFELLDPVDLPVFAAFSVEIAPAASLESVQQALWKTFAGFFAAGNFTFGQPLYLSRMLETAVAVPGVATVVPLRFETWGQPPGWQLHAGVIVPQANQIVLLRNDPNQPGDGTLSFEMTGG